MNQEILTNFLPKTQSFHLLTVSNTSKKIPTKAKNKPLAPEKASVSNKKYQTTKKKDKFELINEMRKIVDPNLSHENWCKTVLQYKPEEYKIFLKKLVPDIEVSKIPGKWKKIKRMLNNMEKSDGRGGALFGNAKEKAEFSKHIEYVIKNKMKSRCFEGLRKHIIPKIKEMFEKNGRKFSDQVFKKHFWSYFLKDPENIAIKTAWKKLKRTKPQQGAGNESFVSENLDVTINDGSDSLILEKDLKFCEEDEEVDKDSKNIEIAIEIPELKEGQEDDQDLEKEQEPENCELVEDWSVGGFFEEGDLIENKRVLEEGDTFYAPYANFENEIQEFFEKQNFH